MTINNRGGTSADPRRASRNYGPQQRRRISPKNKAKGATDKRPTGAGSSGISMSSIQPGATPTGQMLQLVSGMDPGKIGGHARNRTGVYGFAVRCVTTPPRGLIWAGPTVPWARPSPRLYHPQAAQTIVQKRAKGDASGSIKPVFLHCT